MYFTKKSDCFIILHVIFLYDSNRLRTIVEWMFRRLRGSAPSASALCMLPCSESRAACRDIVARWIGLSDSAQVPGFKPLEQSSAGIGFPGEGTDVRKRGIVKSQSRTGVNFENAGRRTVGEFEPACQSDATNGQIDHPMESRRHDRPW